MNGQVLPHGVVAADFQRALGELRTVVDAQWIIAERERLAPYLKLMLPVEDAEHLPAGVVAPASVEEVQRVLKICNRYRIQIWPISTGRNFGYGSASPATRGQLVLDLHRMNRILHVDPVLCTALVEPGVTYQQLQDYLTEHDIPLWLDFPGPGPLVGPLGNTLERGGGNSPYGDHFANACGMEVVLADGRVLRTGTGSLPETTSWQAFKYGYGPYLDGIFTQSNFGIVTKMGLWLMPRPAGHQSLLIQYEHDQDLSKAVETMRPLRLAGTVQNTCVIGNADIIVANMVRRSDIWQGKEVVPDDIIQAEAKKRGIAAWTMLSTLYGTPEQVAPNLAIVKDAFERSGARVTLGVKDAMSTGELTLDSFRVLNWRPGGGLAWFAPVAPALGKDALKQKDLAKRIMARHGFEYLGAPTVGVRDLHHLIALVFDRRDAEEKQRADACFRELMETFTRQGYGLYRAGIGYMDKLAQMYGQTNREVNRAIKRALDPNGIIAPGKSGIRL